MVMMMIIMIITVTVIEFFTTATLSLSVLQIYGSILVKKDTLLLYTKREIYVIELLMLVRCNCRASKYYLNS